MRLLLLVLAGGAALAAGYSAPAGSRPAHRIADAETILPGGRIVVSANGGPNVYSLTALEKRPDSWKVRNLVAPKKKADGELLLSEGDSGRGRAIDPHIGIRKYTLNLNQGGFDDSYTGDLAIDRDRGILYIVDQANFRLVTVGVRRRRVLITNIGMFEYRLVPGADSQQAIETVDRAIFDPAKVKDPLDRAPNSPRMDDPRVLRQEHEELRKARGKQ